ncbi:DUF305 domain-containing protein [Cytophagaceae bacterium YF14B1]|uniref:DUF305 domain-containing protein n=1 Tax=Xanthocytophaga flava TaxID=3048013 RepID=A0AAE3QS79_9BACT|nr:DUF305 domain-containing protein [Xanthocytophaga flavus]MDJ1481703.1 DUF305 domain-containing protein [Xanthocytophaga flavus]
MKTLRMALSVPLLSIASFYIFAVSIHSNNGEATNVENTPVETHKIDTRENITAPQPQAQSKDEIMVADAIVEMRENMQQITLNNHADKDFAGLMKELHQGAIDMAQIEIELGKNNVLKAKARQIVATMEEQMSRLTAHTQKIEKQSKQQDNKQFTTNKFSQMVSKTFTKMDQQISEDELTGDVDQEFVVLMKTLYQGAIDIAQAEVEHGRDMATKQIAKNTVEAFQDEVNQFQSLLENNTLTSR